MGTWKRTDEISFKEMNKKNSIMYDKNITLITKNY